MSYRSDEIECVKNADESLEITIPKFSEMRIYHATNGIDFIKEEQGRKRGFALFVPPDADTVTIRVEVVRTYAKVNEDV